ncbi:MAG: bifunctional hydroxymethylpyrimidine kinase/phosphomethylpyrimidine kinase [Planctomycetota bacterium]
MMRRVLLLGGLDPCGGAGLTADATVVAVHGAQPLPVAIATTAQNRRGFLSCHVLPTEVWREALDAALADGDVHAVKIGLLGAAPTVSLVAAALRPLLGRAPIVVDPVLSATAGGYTVPAAVAAAYREHLLPLATVLTPNHAEAMAVYGGEPRSALAAGCAAVLQKDGHGSGAFAEDILYERTGEVRFRRPRLHIGAVHGTGCALASALATLLARGLDTAAACRGAGDWLASLLQLLGPPAADGLPRNLPLGSVPGAHGPSEPAGAPNERSAISETSRR